MMEVEDDRHPKMSSLHSAVLPPCYPEEVSVGCAAAVVVAVAVAAVGGGGVAVGGGGAAGAVAAVCGGGAGASPAVIVADYIDKIGNVGYISCASC